MLSIAEQQLADVALTDTDKPGFKRYIKRSALGVILIVSPWNYPYLVSVNSVLPAIVAGNSVILKPSPQTPLAAERLQIAFERAGLPKDVLQVVHMSPALTATVAKDPAVDFVSFTGSVVGGRSIQEVATSGEWFKGVCLEVRSSSHQDFI